MADANPTLPNNRQRNTNNSRRDLRLLVELFSLMVVFFFMSAILFSTGDKQVTVSLTLNIPHEAFYALAIIYIVLSLSSLCLLFLNEQARQAGHWVEQADSTPNRFLWAFFWPLLWAALTVTFLAGLVDVSNRVPANWNALTFFGGIFIYLLASVRIITHGIRTTWLRR